MRALLTVTAACALGGCAFHATVPPTASQAPYRRLYALRGREISALSEHKLTLSQGDRLAARLDEALSDLNAGRMKEADIIMGNLQKEIP